MLAPKARPKSRAMGQQGLEIARQRVWLFVLVLEK